MSFALSLLIIAVRDPLHLSAENLINHLVEFAHNSEIHSHHGSFQNDSCAAASPRSSPSNVEQYFADAMVEAMYAVSCNRIESASDMPIKSAEEPTYQDARNSVKLCNDLVSIHPSKVMEFSQSGYESDPTKEPQIFITMAADDLWLEEFFEQTTELGTDEPEGKFQSGPNFFEHLEADERFFSLSESLDRNAESNFISPFARQSDEQRGRTCSKDTSLQHTGCPSSLKEAGSLQIEQIQKSGVDLKELAKTQSGFRRRCLDFDATKSRRKSFGHDDDTGHSDKNAISVSQCIPTVSSVQNLPLILSERAAATSDAMNSTRGTASSDVQPGNISTSMTAFISPPSGLGLHLNSLRSSIRMTVFSNGVPGLGGLSSSKTLFSEDPKEGTAIVAPRKVESSGASLQASLAEDVNTKKQDQPHSFRTQHETIGSCHSATLGVKQLLLQDLSLQPEPSVAEGYLECPQGPKQRPGNKRESVTPGDKAAEDCKTCSCKKSKCLKRYCECFAAGRFCGDSCSCQDCHNKLTFKETVDTSRRLIESRNPIAFRPKTVAISSSFLSKQDKTKAKNVRLSRHKCCCNCRKSQCLKKYCACFQAGVGCSEGCRCENCHNDFGRKDASEGLKYSEPICDSKESESSGSLRQGDRTIEKDVSPRSPSFQHELHGTGEVRLRSSGTVQPVDSSLPQRSKPDDGSLQLDTPQCEVPVDGSLDSASLHNTCSAHILTPVDTPNLKNLSPHWEEAADICSLTPLTEHPLRPSSWSLSTLLSEMSPYFSNQNADLSSYQKELGACAEANESAEILASVTHQSPSGSFAIGGKMANAICSGLGVHNTPVTPLLSPSIAANSCSPGSQGSLSSALPSSDDSNIPERENLNLFIHECRDGTGEVRLRSSGTVQPVDSSLPQRSKPDDGSLQLDTPQCDVPVDGSLDSTSLHNTCSAHILTPVGTPNLKNLSPHWEEAADICSLTPLTEYPLRPSFWSMSTLLSEMSPYFSNQNADLSSYQKEFGACAEANESAENLASVTQQSPTGSFAIGGKMANAICSGLGVHNTPATPLLSPSTAANSCAPGSQGPLPSSDDCNIPDFLEDLDKAQFPPRKSTISPKKKRVTTPHLKAVPTAEIGKIIASTPGPSPVIRKRKRFILQALPPFPSPNSKSIT
ncbi:hypothetical protein O6H91_12G081400 [Diphasiastrum complanatum]|uniref:Uncharacterized protein n=2 Tax=Diphasiastrum complanatum TaxID=34168 RepID=A0ACC2C454_DIPCM|nr:hypothetical protein O6H91_12G081400 [Diphasiastrum complanatum]KAJ7536771.1 hypothetical protein O6H91_12G081400 [Diphasiastrum complanatum]